MSLRPGPGPGPDGAAAAAFSSAAAAAPFPPTPPRRGGEPYNIVPIDDDPLLSSDHPSLRFPEVRAAVGALRDVSGLRNPPLRRGGGGGGGGGGGSPDVLDWLGAFFGFQLGSIRNQREHLVLLLANAQMRLHPPPSPIDALDPSVARRLRKKLLASYASWCAFLDRPSNVWSPDGRGADPRRDLLYAALYLLIWGEAANLRFLPECLCYIFHHMAGELNSILDGRIDPATGRPAVPAVCGEDAFLARVVSPIYETIAAEVEAGGDGAKPHAAWRNYDDLNEYFWRPDVFSRLGWPPDRSAGFFFHPGAGAGAGGRRVGKTGFVEQRSFWNVYRSFDRLWVMLVLFLQAAIIVAWQGRKYPWEGLESRDAQIRVLSVFATWAGLRFLQSLLDAGTQHPLAAARGNRPALAARMLLKLLAAAAWTAALALLYARAWDQRRRDGRWSAAANSRAAAFLEAAGVFVLPELLAVALFLLPWLRNSVEKSNWKVLRALTWWFQTRTFVGRGLREGLIDNIKYSIFWILLLAVKFSFSYFLQIKPMVKPTKAIYGLSGVHYRWHEFFGHANRFAVFLLWLPVILIYLLDIQIWYAIFSALAGAFVGLFAHLGEIRSVRQLRLRFQFFASAMHFNLFPADQMFDDRGVFGGRIKNAFRRVQLRHGVGPEYKKMEPHQAEARRFALIWNEIIATFREEDIISDRELELMELPRGMWNIRVIRWPCLLLGNELLLALGQAKELKASDRKHWKKICKHEYRRCAVIESYDSIKHLLLVVIREGTEEHSIVKQLFLSFDDSMAAEKFTVEYKMPVLADVHAKLVNLLELLIKPKKDLAKVTTTLQGLYQIAVRDFPTAEKSIEQLREEGLAPSRPSELLFVDAVELPGEEEANFYTQVRRLLTVLSSRETMNNVPKNLEARRRIAFFSNSLFMKMPRAPHIEKMLSFSVLTPYYSEDVLFAKEKLRNENEDGISILFYLQKIYEDEWTNFLERMRREGMVHEGEIWSEKLRDLRLWASYRGQTLARTVRGMMYYYKALTMLAFLDSASEYDISEGSRELTSVSSSRRNIELYGLEEAGKSPSPVNLSRANSGVSSLFKGHEYGTAVMKFTYVLACQIYGSQKAKKEANAEDILYLMKNNEALRVAYVDEVGREGEPKGYYSVLVKYDQQLQREVEIYRVKLPGKLKLGEGKPENQNHALIFTRGDAVQTIDMNQDSYFEEALKMRNLLEEFNHKYGLRKPSLLGVREHVFTGSVSSLAWFMSSQEMSFVTLGQRVLANPLKVRMHYGHPDVFDRLWFLSRGGISKASRVINISEDIFAGFNCTLRGGNVTHHEYIQVGKGRDVGLNQISMFEAKVSSGNGEQTLSRDVYRLGHRLDFFRMLSFFYTTVGFYFNTMMVVLTVYAFVWGRLYLALSGLEEAITDRSDTTNNVALGTVLNQQFIIQLGLFTALPMIVENSLEHGFLPATWDFIKMQLELASVFYTFSMGTKAHYFGRTILHGGAKYRATGRGFVVEHKRFAENYRLYARSHFIKAIELGVALITYASFGSPSRRSFTYILMTISSWFLVVSWIIAPFVFNPSGFDWLKNFDDFDEFIDWIWQRPVKNTKSENSWEVWWNEEQQHLRNTGFWGNFLEIVLDLRYFFFQYGIVYRLNIADGSTSIVVYLVSWTYVFFAFGLFILVAHVREKYEAEKHFYYRAVQIAIIVLVIAVIIILLKFTHFQFIDIFTSLLAFVPTGWGILSIAQVIRPVIQRWPIVWDTVVGVARLYDILFGVIIFAPLTILSWLPGLPEMQTRILFSEGFSRGLQISRIVTGKKPKPKGL